MAAARLRGSRKKLLNVRAAGASVSRVAMGTRCEPPRFFWVERSRDREVGRISINLGMRVPSVSIFDVYPRTLESAFTSILVSRNSGRRRLRMPSISGDSPNGSPVHRIQGASQMHKKQFDVIPLRCALDSATRIDGPPSDVRTSTVMLGEAEKLRGGDRFRLVRSPLRHFPAYLAQDIGRMMSANHAIASSRAIAHGGVQARSAAFRRGMAAHFSVDQRIGE
ncbi:hypothetical protein SAMN05216330_11477 [Bradyrhizobium sp. Ghvi]|nr:hypothetical protein SAMN05216330_11477 [Bradyrhizobium sp. Ghvi]